MLSVTEIRRLAGSNNMSHGDRLTTTVIQNVFAEEITALGGTVTDLFSDCERLFVRSVLPRVREILPRDSVQDGVALRVTERDVWIHPYVFRRVCRNGAIIAHALGSWKIDRIDDLFLEEAESAVREGVRVCADEESFTTAAEAMRSASQTQADLALMLMPLLSHLAGRDVAQLLRGIMDRFMSDGDSTRFGLMNAVTSTARDTNDPDLRWRLEEFGGGILVERPQSPSFDPSRAMELAEV
jgi:hypothetical protein